MKQYHSRDLRKGRFSEPDRPYLITTATFRRERLFSNETLARFVIREIQSAEKDDLVSTVCWVIMPDHFHWLVTLKRLRLDNVIRQVKSRSAISINKALNRCGRIWQAGFHDRALRRDEDIETVARYVVANPLRAGLVTNLDDYALWDAAWIDRGSQGSGFFL